MEEQSIRKPYLRKPKWLYTKIEGGEKYGFAVVESARIRDIAGKAERLPS